MSKGNTKPQNMIGTISTESILIGMESNWIQMFSLYMMKVTSVLPKRLAMIKKGAASMLRRRCYSQVAR